MLSSHDEINQSSPYQYDQLQTLKTYKEDTRSFKNETGPLPNSSAHSMRNQDVSIDKMSTLSRTSANKKHTYVPIRQAQSFRTLKNERSSSTRLESQQRRLNSGKQKTQEFSNIMDHRRKSTDKSKDEQPRNYRLISLEKKFNNQNIRAKDQIEAISRKLEVLQNNNLTQKDHMRHLDNEKRETHSTDSYLQSNIKDLQTRVRN